MDGFDNFAESSPYQCGEVVQKYYITTYVYLNTPCKTHQINAAVERSYESRLFQVLDENGVNKLILGYRLNHQHSLLPQMGQHFWNVNVNIVVDAIH